MGAKRKVDEKLYNKITRELKTPKDDKNIMKKYNLGQTTVRAIRNSWCYADFVSRTSHKRESVVMRESLPGRHTPSEVALTIAVYLGLLLFAVALVMVIIWLIGKIF